MTSFDESSDLEILVAVQTPRSDNVILGKANTGSKLSYSATRAPYYNRARRNFRSLFQDVNFLSRNLQK